MSSIHKIFQQNRFFFAINVPLICLFIVLSCLFSHGQGFIWINQIHNNLLTNIFEIITILGDGWFIIIISISLLLSKSNRTLAFIILLSYVSSGIFVQILKNCIHSPRPSTYFEIHHYKYYLEAFAHSRVGFNSFPSGHTASFFALATVISHYFRRRHICMSMLFLSAVVGYSRIYLGHHFLIDVIFGAIIGIIFGSFSAIWVGAILANPHFRKKIKKWKQSKTYLPNPSFNN